MIPTVLLAVIISALNAWGFWVLNRSVILGKEKANTASWNLWVLLTIVNLSSYFTMNQDWYLSTLLLTDTSLCVLIWALAWKRGSFELPPRRDYLPISLAIAATVIWKLSSATDANLFTQVPMMLSFVPYMSQAWRGEASAKPWVFWTSSFALDLPLVHLRHLQTGRGDWQDFVFPGLATLFHGSVMAIALYRNWSRRSTK